MRMSNLERISAVTQAFRKQIMKEPYIKVLDISRDSTASIKLHKKIKKIGFKAAR